MAYPRIVNGLTTHAYPAVGALLRGDLTAPSEHLPITADTATLYASGTLIGCRTFLTCGHCVSSPPFGAVDLLPDEAWVYLQHAGLFTVTSVARHPAYMYPVADVAVLKLGAPVTGIEPARINASDPNPFIPLAGTIVDFGRTGGLDFVLDPSTFDLGLKRTGRVETTAFLPGLSPNPDSELVCYDFLKPIGPPGDDSAICHGDSGGPLFLDLGFGPLVAGVTSGLTRLSCLPPVHDYDANVYTYRDFILTELGEDETSTCGGLPPVGDAQVDVLGFDGRLDDVAPSASHTVGVGLGRNSVRFALNAIETRVPTLGSADRLFVVDMYVKAGPGASPTDFDCKADAASVFGACIFDLPAAGTYSVFLQRVIGEGEYQLTATIFGGPPPVCGDGSLAFNEQCDDGNRDPFDGCTNDCTVCGDGVVTPPEECDDGNTFSGDGCDAQCRRPHVVGTGTPESCTEAEFAVALAQRSVTFNCGPDPVTITFTSEKAITAGTTIDGGGLVTLSGSGAVRIFTVGAGAALDVRNLTIAGGYGGQAGGGAIRNEGTLTLTNCTLSRNSAEYGGGIFNYLGTATLTSCTLSRNSADAGGGIVNLSGTLTLTNCTLSNNSAAGVGPYTFNGSGSGILNLVGTLALTNTTLSGNSAHAGGGIENTGDGPGCGSLIVTNSTFSGNSADAGAGGIECRCPTLMTNSIIANSSGANCGFSCIEGGHNLQFPGTSCGETIPSLDPKLDLAGLLDNGGPTQTIALLPGSPAINAGDPEVCASPPVNGVDQRGYVRPGTSSANCSIGAYEYNSPGPPAGCLGDCRGDQQVTIDELLTVVNIALGTTSVAQCSSSDVNHDNQVTIDEILTAVNAALNGCDG